MKEQIEMKIREWNQELDQLNAKRQQLATAMTDVDVSIQRHLGAIEGARQLLALTQPAPDEAEPEPV